ncbi:gliding motility-associated C-terminal domain-containing protein [Mucilaginibacter sp. HMF5004]|uniref:T9SS type B sorting domain-containing protein n=1 Tax=Mucilaginibacter rivuli TaxID=2857527 RepID=UPI001C5F07B0|nr:gliding motility-associated C-terminal domain-containing protein [Mucilaginibacter rivuli]MBW4890231.1 gliding motility-associated C-terminal domain-containing protein [Mucilaginibacter rivuli]
MIKYYPFRIVLLCFLLWLAVAQYAIASVATPPPPPGSVSLIKQGIFSANYITYIFTVKNAGLSVINSIALNDAQVGLVNYPVAVPVGGLLPGASVIFSTKYTLSQADKDAGIVNNTATAICVDNTLTTLASVSTVAISVPKSPLALDDAGVTTIDQPVTIAVLNNDNPGNSTFNPTTVAIVSQPKNGTVITNATGTVTYTPKPHYNGPDKFTYRVQDAYGYYTNVATITITQTLVAGALRVPNLFTPNGDGINDVFEIRGLEQYYANELIIVNRWGNEVYHSTHYQNNWTGGGLNEGTYFYTIKVMRTATTETETYKGYVTLSRPR